LCHPGIDFVKIFIEPFGFKLKKVIVNSFESVRERVKGRIRISLPQNVVPAGIGQLI
jgi:hypothetical protein